VPSKKNVHHSACTPSVISSRSCGLASSKGTKTQEIIHSQAPDRHWAVVAVLTKPIVFELGFERASAFPCQRSRKTEARRRDGCMRDVHLLACVQ
jgi:hypothetical protein